MAHFVELFRRRQRHVCVEPVPVGDHRLDVGLVGEQPVALGGVARPALLDGFRAEIGEGRLRRIPPRRLVGHPDLRARGDRAVHELPHPQREPRRDRHLHAVWCRRSLPLGQRHLQQVRHRMLTARRGCGRPDDSHRQPTARKQPGQVGEPCGLGIACGLREGRKRGHRGENLFDDSGVIGGPVAEPRRELPFGDRVGNRGQVAHPGEVQPDGCRGEDVGVGDRACRAIATPPCVSPPR